MNSFSPRSAVNLQSRCSNQARIRVLAVCALIASFSALSAAETRPDSATAQPASVAVVFTDDLNGPGTNAPSGWLPGEANPEPGTYQWETNSGINDSRCLSLTATNQASDIFWKHQLQLEPRTAYVFRGQMKAQDVTLANAAWVGANLSWLGTWYCSSDSKKSTGTFDWQEFTVDFSTGESGQADLACRLGQWSSLAKGKVWFDNLRVERLPQVTRREGRHVYLNLFDEDTAGISEATFDRWLDHLDQAYEAMLELVGHAPFKGAKTGIFSPRWNVHAWAYAGNPIIWGKSAVKSTLAACEKKDDWSSGLLHEMGHNFDEAGGWNFNPEFWANFKEYYAVVTLGGRVNLGRHDYNATNFINYWKSDAGSSWERAWQNPDSARRNAHHDGLQYKMIVIQEKIGWEPFKQTFRWFHRLPKNEKPKGKWNQFKTFHDQLAAFSGFDVWSVYTPEEIKLLKREYPDHASPNASN